MEALPFLPNEVIRSTKEEKEQQIQNLHAFWKRNENISSQALKKLQNVAVNNENIFTELMETVKYCSLGTNYTCTLRSRRPVQEKYVKKNVLYQLSKF